jgi:multiple sugar transport system permease protein
MASRDTPMTELSVAKVQAVPRSDLTGRWTGRLMVTPAILIILLVTIYPMLFALTTSFKRFDPRVAEHNTFVGLENYRAVIRDGEFRQSLRNTVLIAVPALALELVLGLGLALLVVGPIRGKGIFLTLFMLPVLTIPVVVGITWRMLWHPTYGPINQILSWIVRHQVNINWLNQPGTAIPAIIITEVWQWTPFMFLVLLAGLTAIPTDITEAAAIDGASRWQSFRFITLPLMKRTMVIGLLLRSLDIIKIFDIIWVMNEGGPGTASQPIAQYIYRLGRYLQLDRVTASSFLLLIIIVILINMFRSRLKEVE